MYWSKFEDESNQSNSWMASSLEILIGVGRGLMDVGQVLIHANSIAFNLTYENDGNDVINQTETTADGSKFSSHRRMGNGAASRYNYYKSFFHSIITFIGLPSRIGDDGFTLLQFARDLIAGWNPLPRNREGKLAWGEFNTKNWLNIIGSILLIKPIVIPAIIIATWPLRLARNILKLGTEHLPLMFYVFFAYLSNHFYESLTGTWEKTKSWTDHRHFLVYGGIKTIKLLVFGSLFIASYLLSTAFTIVHKVGMLITSPDKSRRYWYNMGNKLSSDSMLKYIPFASYILPALFSVLSVVASALTWAMIFPLLISALTTFFPVLIPTVTSIANLPLIAASLKMISATVISVSTTFVGIFAPVIAVLNAVAAAVGIQVTTTYFAVGFTLGAIAAPFAVGLTFVADKLANLWATLKGADRYEPLAWVKHWANSDEKYNIGFATHLARELFETHMPEYESEICQAVANYCYDNIINWESKVRNKNAQDFIAQIDEQRKTANQEIVKRRLAGFKHHLEKKYQHENKYREEIPENEKLNWKDLLYGANYTKQISSHTKEAPSVKIKGYVNCVTPIDATTRAKELPVAISNQGATPDAAAAMGTTFFTHFAPELRVTQVLDSCLVAHQSYQYNGSRMVYLAMADGLGGHTGDNAKDTSISRASYFGCKHAIRLSSTYNHADTLKANLSTIITNVSAEILSKNKGQPESISLTCATVFPVVSGQWGAPIKHRVIGVNLGENMLLAWNPKTQTVITLLSKRSLVPNAEPVPAILPDNYTVDKSLDIDDVTVDVTLDSDTVLIPFTKGMLGEFNTITREEEKNGKKYNVTEINPDWIIPKLSELPKDASSKAIVQTLMQHIMTQAEDDRKVLTAQAKRAAKAKLFVGVFEPSAREQGAKEMDDLREQDQLILAQKERAEITEEEFTRRKQALDQQREALEKSTKNIDEGLVEIDEKTRINYGDDVTVMAVSLQ